jgi:hypothetical protein
MSYCVLCMITCNDVQHFTVVHLFSFLCCVFCLVCLCPVSCVPNLASFSGLFHSSLFVFVLVSCVPNLVSFSGLFHSSFSTWFSLTFI